MKITVIGAGAMGSLFGGYLSKENEITVIDISEKLVDSISKDGVRIKEKDGTIAHLHPNASTDSSSLPYQDLVIIFVKSMYTLSALETNKHLIGSDTFLMTLQNGAGHESKLLKYADKSHVIIGSTQHNASVIETGFIYHGGSGITSIGTLDENSIKLEKIAKNFSSCGLECKVSNNVQKQIWKKLFTNTAASSLTALFQVPLGFIHTDPYANSIMRDLCSEAVEVANAFGLNFNLEEVIYDVEQVLINGKDGYTSIYADIRDGRTSEVDTISGFVVKAAKDVGVAVPCHKMVVRAIHALENRNATK